MQWSYAYISFFNTKLSLFFEGLDHNVLLLAKNLLTSILLILSKLSEKYIEPCFVILKPFILFSEIFGIVTLRNVPLGNLFLSTY